MKTPPVEHSVHRTLTSAPESDGTDPPVMPEVPPPLVRRAENSFWRFERTLDDLDPRPQRRLWLPRRDRGRVCVDPCPPYPTIRLYPRTDPNSEETDSRTRIGFLRAARVPEELLDPVDVEALADSGLHRSDRGYLVMARMNRDRCWASLDSDDVRAIAHTSRQLCSYVADLARSTTPSRRAWRPHSSDLDRAGTG